MSEAKFPQRVAYRHEISTQEDLNFLCNWMKVLFNLNPDARGRVNDISINLTGKFICIDQAGVITIEKVEGWKP